MIDKNALLVIGASESAVKTLLNVHSRSEGCEMAGYDDSNSSWAKLSRRRIARLRRIAVAQIIVLLIIAIDRLSETLKLRQGLQSIGHLGQRVVRDGQECADDVRSEQSAI